MAINLIDLDNEESNIYMAAFDAASTGSQEQAGIDAVEAHRAKKEKPKRSILGDRLKRIDEAGGY